MQGGQRQHIHTLPPSALERTDQWLPPEQLHCKWRSADDQASTVNAGVMDVVGLGCESQTPTSGSIFHFSTCVAANANTCQHLPTPTL